MTNYAVEDIALGYAPVPPEMLFHRPKVTESEMKTWCVFALFRTLATGESHVGVTTVAEILGVDRTTVGRAIDGLVSKGFLIDLGRGRDEATGKMLHRRFACAVEGQRLRYGRVKESAKAHDAAAHRGAETHDATHDASVHDSASVHKTDDENHDAHHEASHDATHDASVHQPIYTEGDLRKKKVTEDPSGGAPPGRPAAEDAQTHESKVTADGVVRLFFDCLAAAREARGTATDEQRPIPRDGVHSRGAFAKEVAAELASGRDPELVQRAAMRRALRWDGHSMGLGKAMGDVIDGKPWTFEQEYRARNALTPNGSGGARPDAPKAGESKAEARKRREEERLRQMDEVFGTGAGRG